MAIWQHLATVKHQVRVHPQEASSDVARCAEPAFLKTVWGPERGSECPSSDTMCPTTRNVGLYETKGVDSNKQ